MIDKKQFEKNYNLKIDHLIETRGGSFNASYLSWANAVRLLKENHPELTVDVVEICDGFVTLQMINIETGIKSGRTYFPCMDNRFNAIENPTAVDYNYAVQRGTAKIIAINTGIGLKLYVGEDIPSEDDGQITSTQTKPQGQIVDNLHWSEAIVPIGFDKGKKLGDVMNPKWLIENFKANEKFADSIAFRKALDDCHQAQCTEKVEPIDDIAEQSANDPTDPDEEVPF